VTVAVKAHGFAQMLKLDGIQFHNRALSSKYDCEIGCTVPVLWISVVVVSLAVVKKGEPRQDRRINIERMREAPAVIPDPAPVRDAMDSVS
jgi:hypothetical protein